MDIVPKQAAEYTVRVADIEINAMYSNMFKTWEQTYNAVSVSIAITEEVPVTTKLVAERFILTGLPRPGYEKRVGKAVTKASKLVDNLNHQ